MDTKHLQERILYIVQNSIYGISSEPSLCITGGRSFNKSLTCNKVMNRYGSMSVYSSIDEFNNIDIDTKSISIIQNVDIRKCIRYNLMIDSLSMLKPKDEFIYNNKVNMCSKFKRRYTSCQEEDTNLYLK